MFPAHHDFRTRLYGLVNPSLNFVSDFRRNDRSHKFRFRTPGVSHLHKFRHFLLYDGKKCIQDPFRSQYIFNRSTSLTGIRKPAFHYFLRRHTHVRIRENDRRIIATAFKKERLHRCLPGYGHAGIRTSGESDHVYPFMGN